MLVSSTIASNLSIPAYKIYKCCGGGGGDQWSFYSKLFKVAQLSLREATHTLSDVKITHNINYRISLSYL